MPGRMDAETQEIDVDIREWTGGVDSGEAVDPTYNLVTSNRGGCVPTTGCEV